MSEYLSKPQKFNLNWQSSKELLAREIERVHGGRNLAGFIYDLGHSGRLFPDFGKEHPVPLTFTRKAKLIDPQSHKGERLKVLTLPRTFWGMIYSAIVAYPEMNEKIVGDSVEVLNNVVRQMNEKTELDLVFSPFDFDRKFRGLLSLQEN